MKRILLICLVVGLGLSTQTLAAGQTPPKEERIVDKLFTELEKQTIERYYRDRFGKETDHKQKKKSKGNKEQKGLPPGLAKRETLPPGLAQQLQRNGQLPPGLEKRDLPDDLRSMLPKRLPGHRRVIVDNDVLLIEEATGLILDILEDIF
jgi:Ni/Co efflux regulator RcnB